MSILPTSGSTWSEAPPGYRCLPLVPARRPEIERRCMGLITDSANQKLIRPASYWEIAIKIRLGKYALPVAFESFMTDQIARNHFVVVPITVAHAAVIATRPQHHKD